MRHLSEDRESSRHVGRTATLAGLACVYSGVFWLFGMLGAVNNSWLPGAAAYGVCLAGSLGFGVGLCAGERWAWAGVTCLAAAYAVGAVAVGGVMLNGILTVRALSWQPVAAGLPLAAALRVLLLAVVVFAGAVGALWLFWRAQPEYDVPYRRSFTTLLHDGAVLAAAVFAADLFLLYHAWTALAIRP